MAKSLPFIEIDHVDQVFDLPGGDRYIALKNIHLEIQKGEFISLVGHSGCGKSTLLNIIAGFQRPSSGGVVMAGRQVTEPGPDRMVVFQNYSLLPWKTVYQNVALAVAAVLGHLSKAEQRQRVEAALEQVHLSKAREKFPAQLSGGMKQRVAIARALAIQPEVLLLDEPFGALDALTRGSLQDELMQVCQGSQTTCIMVTHDVDEALLLSDRVVLLTNGPEAHIGQILKIPFARPRNRHDVLNHPSYYGLRNEMIAFLNQQKRRRPSLTVPAIAPTTPVELTLGFMPLMDSAPLIVAKEMGFFAKYGLESVTLHREESWQDLVMGVIAGRLTGAQLLAAMPLAMTLGLNGQPSQPLMTSLVLSRNGNAITFSRQLWQQGVKTAEDLRAYIQRTGDRPRLGVVHAASMHNLLLRYWLAAAGIDPDYDVELLVIPPSQMIYHLKAGHISSFCVGQPWNSHAVREGIGVIVATDLEIWSGHPEKVVGMRSDWVQANPQLHQALVKALIEACEYCDTIKHRPEIAQLLCRPEYVGCTPEDAYAGFVEPLDRGDGIVAAFQPRFHQFYVDRSPCPGRLEGLWIMTQLARWQLTPFPRNWLEIVEQVRRVDLFGAAARELKVVDNEPDRSAFALFDGLPFDPDNPLGYIEAAAIRRGLDIRTVDPQEVVAV
ncbi:nitrate ABC transporter ATP-binding protein [Thermosynechococcus sp. QKsg1]|uniref:ABC transporter ATP-binding/substrate-binding protein n=1 Tax=unclassified Thermosynechococcus TaxID=2622553 RepID=UPI0025791CF5|nr:MULTISPECIES: nitrate ABC transporter ATP-binding protein [unclassified Thermosynechococcus]MDR7921063.1 nitrate ABC transporter ATP-binding protein [Thermosynechococcus sp. HY213]WJI25930.1 nitrate ABC transporter ATP-binding protein [Thermosynechococcus sp. B1]WJI28458.1 nitrate ABC transporter ATP-binding protein [Thermosynechococcus sp. B3]WKT83041.1 nitrate ABC transporter ATP-binding protein [Thermosynechococcus sp. HY596]WNC62168.1 nitrate ABC transporter ATP-binding protein [Thermos